MDTPPRPDMLALATFTTGVVPYIEWQDARIASLEKLLEMSQ